MENKLWLEGIITSKPNPKKYIGAIDTIKIQQHKSQYFIKSISKGCENCGENYRFDIFEYSSNYQLLFIPAGKGDFSYEIKCHKCDALVLNIEPIHMNYLKKHDLIDNKNNFS